MNGGVIMIKGKLFSEFPCPAAVQSGLKYFRDGNSSKIVHLLNEAITGA